jgi:competence protein ComEC
MSSPPVELAVLNVGQGDTIVVSVPSTSEAVVIDCVDAESVIEHLHDRRIEHLRALVLTHLHLDHYRDAVRLLRNCEKRLNLRCEGLYFHWHRPRSRAEHDRLLRDADAHGDDGVPAHMAENIRRTGHRELLKWIEENPRVCGGLARGKGAQPFGGTFGQVLEVVHPWHAHLHMLSGSGLNDTSAVLRVNGSGSSALLTGDIEACAWAMMTEGGVEELRADVLKFPHHGAWLGGDPREVLDAVQPKAVIVSVGTRGAAYDHPNDDVLAAIRERFPGIRLLCTQATGKCGPASAVADRASAEHEHRPASFRSGARAAGSCPCAGTVIVSLAGTAEILQPTVAFHQDRIIRPLLPTHQCALPTAPNDQESAARRLITKPSIISGDVPGITSE